MPMQPGEAYKAFVAVDVSFNAEGNMLPRAIVWEDGQRYAIDKVKQIRPARAAKAGGQGDRYTILVNGQIRYLFFERSTNLSGDIIGRWFVERKEPK